MKKTIFIIFTVLSILSYGFAGGLLTSHFAGESVGMTMIFLVPLLICGLVTGGTALFLKRTKAFELNQFSVGLHYLNLLLIVLGIAALFYAFLE